jgi:integral membrane sensor domain MASE1
MVLIPSLAHIVCSSLYTIKNDVLSTTFTQLRLTEPVLASCAGAYQITSKPEHPGLRSVSLFHAKWSRR